MADSKWWKANSLWEFNSRSIDIVCKCTNRLHMNMFNKEWRGKIIGKSYACRLAMCNASCPRHHRWWKTPNWNVYERNLGNTGGKPMQWISFVNVKDSKCIIHRCIGFGCGKWDAISFHVILWLWVFFPGHILTFEAGFINIQNRKYIYLQSNLAQKTKKKKKGCENNTKRRTIGNKKRVKHRIFLIIVRLRVIRCVSFKDSC